MRILIMILIMNHAVDNFDSVLPYYFGFKRHNLETGKYFDNLCSKNILNSFLFIYYSASE